MGRIVETEAYLDASDLASHTARLRRGRVLTMFGSTGIAYIHQSYGIHVMLNAVAHPDGGVGGILLRAAEPVEGLETMRQRRGGVSDLLLCSGPGRLCQAFGVGLDDHGTDLTVGQNIWIGSGFPPQSIRAGERIGISRSRELPLRFFEEYSPHVSRGDGVRGLRFQIHAAANANEA